MPKTHAQTLERGIAALMAVAAERDGISTAELAGRAGLNRVVVHRLLQTLHSADLVERRPDGAYGLGSRAVALSQNAAGTLQGAARAELTALSSITRATALLAVPEDDDVVVVASFEPAETSAFVAYRVGFRHALSCGATGLAILAGGPPRRGEPRGATQSRARGYAVSLGQVKAGVAGIAAPIVAHGCVLGSIGIVTFADAFDEKRLRDPIVRAAASISRRAAALPLGGPS